MGRWETGARGAAEPQPGRSAGGSDDPGGQALILFLDTSALVKLYLAEEGSAGLREEARAASALAVSRVAWVEMASAMARRAREQPADAPAIDEARKRLGRDWPRYFIVEVTQALVEIAGDYADAFALRAYDAVQLASARTVQQAADEEVGFACFDHRLRTAAAVLGMRSIPG